MTWCERHPHDCARARDLQEREWLRSRDFGVSVFDAAATIAVVAALIIGLIQ